MLIPHLPIVWWPGQWHCQEIPLVCYTPVLWSSGSTGTHSWEVRQAYTSSFMNHFLWNRLHKGVSCAVLNALSDSQNTLPPHLHTHEPLHSLITHLPTHPLTTYSLTGHGREVFRPVIERRCNPVPTSLSYREREQSKQHNENHHQLPAGHYVHVAASSSRLWAWTMSIDILVALRNS